MNITRSGLVKTFVIAAALSALTALEINLISRGIVNKEDINKMLQDHGMTRTHSANTALQTTEPTGP